MRMLLAFLAGCAAEATPPDVGLPVADPSTAQLPCSGETTCDEYGCWVTMCGGTYTMGAPPGVDGEPDEYPPHEVTVDTFRINQTEVTVPAWTACLAAGACFEPGGQDPTYPSFVEDPLCNRAEQGDADDMPVNCIDWSGATELCEFLGGRLPTEAEWEYAARNLGQDILYPWGDDPPSCDNVRVDTDLFDLEGDCHVFGTYPVCSVPAGNTAQGLCDVAGNVIEWCDDWHHDTYDGAPTDGSSWDSPATPYKIMRGGGTGSSEDLRVSKRIFHQPTFWYPGLGVRCVR